MQGYFGSRLARVGAANSDTNLLVSLAQERLGTLVEATERAWGGARLEQRLVICDGPEFEQLFPDHLWWIEQIDPEWRADRSEIPWLLELLGVAATWPTTEVTAQGDAPSAGEHVVALHAPRIVQVCDALSISVAGLFDAVVAHEYSHHADGVLTERQASSRADAFRAEHMAQLQAWNALTFLPRVDGDRARQAMLALADGQPLAYTRFRNLPTVEATLPLGDDPADPLLVPLFVAASPYPKPDDHSSIDVGSQETADALKAADTSIVVLVNKFEENRSRQFTMLEQLSTEEKRDLFESDNPPKGVQLAKGVYRLLDVQGTTLRLTTVDGQRADRRRYAYTVSSGPLVTPRRLSTWGGRLVEG